MNNCVLIGSVIDYVLNDEETACNVPYNNCKVISNKKIIYDRCQYTSQTYGHFTKINSLLIETTTGCIGIITNICSFSPHEQDNTKIIIFYKELIIDSVPYIQTRNVTVTHIKVCHNEFGRLHAITPESLLRPCIIMKMNDKTYISRVSRGCVTVWKYW